MQNCSKVLLPGTDITLTPAAPVVEEETAEVVTEEDNDTTFTPIPGPELQVLGTLPESVDPREIQALVTALGQDIGTIDGVIGSDTNAGIEGFGP